MPRSRSRWYILGSSGALATMAVPSLFQAMYCPAYCRSCSPGKLARFFKNTLKSISDGSGLALMRSAPLGVGTSPFMLPENQRSHHLAHGLAAGQRQGAAGVVAHLGVRVEAQAVVD